jgi:transposase
VKTRDASVPIVLAFCWIHLRRRFYEIAVGNNAPLAEDALRQIGTLVRISGRAKLADVIRYAIRHWPRLIRFLDDGRIEIA